MSQIDFRCWYCNKRYLKPPASVDERFGCSCGQTLKVPKRTGGYCRVKRSHDYLVEAVVYGGGCGLLGFFLGVMLVGKAPWRGSGAVLAGLTLAGVLVGTFGGEAAVNYFGAKVRGREGRNG